MKPETTGCGAIGIGTTAVGFFVLGLLSGFYFSESAQARLQLPEFYKDEECRQEYNSSTGKPEGWQIDKDGIYISQTHGSCADFYKIFGEKP